MPIKNEQFRTIKKKYDLIKVQEVQDKGTRV